ncbi:MULTISPECIES: DUF3826 domain-containing protein [Segatella]|jgi:hypothetical protein|uniref:Uncharacterized protein n=2 Tax=Segatella TaxID=2974251 RepID=D8DW08_9BACT|nr:MULTISPECIES: DUF3826 domain-containing protein [Segatella]EFI72387.1 conserved hypothetical protein [Segatella baroniae B14]UKK78019.1 DUF3826 domain-containing protein [Segatella baroniae B14]SEA27316.1 Protein of unknown function [Segatella bryantii]SEP85141.1 Protein of unknown function [Segatella baroniae B14]GJG27694.1 hypothetical protein PRRU23_13940 [Segatella bryantii]
MKKGLVIIGLVLLSTSVHAQVALDSVGRKADYVKSILGRSEKIVNGLNLTSDYTRKNVVNIVCNRYFYLSDCEDKLKGDALQAELYRHHFEFAAALGNYLSDKEIEAVKDGMTYGVVPKTYQAYQDMIPSLKENEKLQILNWLKEAREFAVDAGTSKAKHGWFGKYKGRINNWLSQRGYDLNKEREGWNKRIAAQKK